MTDTASPAVQAACAALEELDAARVPTSLLAQIAVESAEPAWHAELERTVVAPLRDEVRRLQNSLARQTQ